MYIKLVKDTNGAYKSMSMMEEARLTAKKISARCDKKELSNRSSTITGHMSAITDMISKGNSPDKVLQQICDVESATKRLKKKIIENYITSNINVVDSTNGAKLSQNMNDIIKRYVN